MVIGNSSAIEPELLWTNSSISSDLSSNTLTFSGSYSGYLIYINYNKNGITSVPVYVEADGNTHTCTTPSTTYNYNYRTLYARNFTATSNSLGWSNAIQNGQNPLSEYNGYCIVTQVYGIADELFA